MSNQENTNSSNKSKLFKSGSYSLISTLVLIGIVIAINIFTHFIPTKYTQFDTSYNKLYSITDETKAIIGNLSNDITIYWIARESYKDDSVELLLNEYKTYSNKITIKEVDPELNPSFGKKYTDSLQDNSIIVEAGYRFKYLGYNDLFETDYSNYYTTGDTEISLLGEQIIKASASSGTEPSVIKLNSL